MSAQPRSEESPWTPTVAQQVDELCGRFEAAWEAGGSPSIEDYLREAPEPIHKPLLRGLISLEVACRRRRGEEPDATAYRERFSQLARISHHPTRFVAGSLRSAFRR